MAVEYRIQFEDPTWLSAHKAQVEQTIRELSTFVSQAGNEFWLKDPTSTSTWAFDVRVFVEAGSILLEVSSKTRSFRDDLRRLYETLAASSAAHLEDCDDPDEEVDPRLIFR